LACWSKPVRRFRVFPLGSEAVRRAPTGREVEHVQILEVPGSEFRVSGSGFRDPGFSFWVSGPEIRVSCFGLRVYRFGFRDLSVTFREQESGSRISGPRIRELGLGFWDSGFGIRFSGEYLLSPMPPYTTSLSPAITWMRV